MKHAALALVLFVAIVIGRLEAMGLVEAGLLGLVFLWVLVGSLGLLALGLIRKSRRHAMRGLGLGAVFFAGMLVGHVCEGAQVRSSKGRGDQICAALRAYRERVGTYPPSLSALVSGHLPDVLPTAMGVVRRFEFQYERLDSGDFDLSFEQPAWTGWRRGSASEWRWYD